MIDIKDFQLSLDDLDLALSEFSDDGSVNPEARLNIAGQSVRDESVQYRVAQMMDAGNDWLTYSVYGQMFYELRKGTMGARIV